MQNYTYKLPKMAKLVFSVTYGRPLLLHDGQPLKRVDHVPWRRVDRLPRSAWINSREARGLPPWSVLMASLGARG